MLGRLSFLDKQNKLRPPSYVHWYEYPKTDLTSISGCSLRLCCCGKATVPGPHLGTKRSEEEESKAFLQQSSHCYPCHFCQSWRVFQTCSQPSTWSDTDADHFLVWDRNVDRTITSGRKLFLCRSFATNSFPSPCSLGSISNAFTRKRVPCECEQSIGSLVDVRTNLLNNCRVIYMGGHKTVFLFFTSSMPNMTNWQGMQGHKCLWLSHAPHGLLVALWWWTCKAANRQLCFKLRCTNCFSSRCKHLRRRTASGPTICPLLQSNYQ